MITGTSLEVETGYLTRSRAGTRERKGRNLNVLFVVVQRAFLDFSVLS